MTTIKHMRVGMGFDVAYCGARGVAFTCVPKLMTCPECLAKREDPRRRAGYIVRMKRQAAGRRAWMASMRDER